MKNGDILPLEFMARREDWTEGISLYLRQRTVGFGSVMAHPPVMETVEPGARALPMMTIDIQTAQNLMDELWQCGVRPTEGTGSAGAMAAVQAHLKDMQRLVFKEKAK